MRPEDQFHVGVVVPDLDRALDELAEAFGYRWTDEVQADQPILLPEGEVTVGFRFRYSVEEPRIEVIEERPGTPWVVAGSGIHHLGRWSDDLEADGAALARIGYELEATVAGDDPPFAYHRHPLRPRIELVDRRIEPLLAPLWEDRMHEPANRAR